MQQAHSLFYSLGQGTNAGPGSDVFSLARLFSHRLSSFLAPLLLEPAPAGQHLFGLCERIFRHRNRPTSHLLLELGEVLFSTDNHFFDRECASKEWLGVLLSEQDLFLMRSPSAYKLADVLKRVKRSSLFSVGGKATSF